MICLNIYKYHSYFITLITFIGSAFFMLGFDMFLQAKKITTNIIHMKKSILLISHFKPASFMKCFFAMGTISLEKEL